MKKGELILVIIIISIALLFFSYQVITGRVSNAIPSFGPSQEEQTCMRNCASIGCSVGDMTCMQKNSGKCMTQCNVVKPEETTEQACVSECTKDGCGEYDFTCQEKNREKCDKECGMIKAPNESEMSAEQVCITECVNAEAPGTICGSSQEGETGNELCQRCAQSCVHLYAGPCLDDEKLTAKKKECETCEHCYGEPVMGDSGEGWECIVSVECKDATNEFGDEPGTGPGVGQEGFIANVGESIGNVAESVGDFLSGLFFGNSE